MVVLQLTRWTVAIDNDLKLYGGKGSDELFGGKGHDKIDGGDDDDKLKGVKVVTHTGDKGSTFYWKLK